MINRAKKYSWKLFVGDCGGGAIAALIALPYGLSMAALMGLPPILGILTSILTAPIIALLGRNAMLIGGTGSVTVPFIAAAVRSQGIGGAAKVSIVASVLMMAFCVLKLGRHVSKVPHAVVAGFSVGIGGIMVISQLNVIFGVAAPKGSNAVMQLLDVFSQIGHARLAPFVLSGLVIGAAFVCGRFAPRIPAPLVGIALAGLAAIAFHFHESEVGSLKLELPDFAGFAWNPQDVVQVIPSGLALAFVTAVNLLMTSRVVEHFRGRHQHMKRTDADAELGAYGIANLCAGIFGAPMSVGIPARSLAAVRCGGTTRVSNLLHAVFLIFLVEAGIGLSGAHSAGGASRSDGMDGLLSTRLERVASAPQNASDRRGSVSGDRDQRPGGERGGGGPHRMLAVRHSVFAGTGEGDGNRSTAGRGAARCRPGSAPVLPPLTVPRSSRA